MKLCGKIAEKVDELMHTTFVQDQFMLFVLIAKS